MPPKRSNSSAAVTLHPVAAKIPSLPKTHNKLIDEDNEDKMQLLREIVSACLEDLNHVSPLFTKLRERQRMGTVDESKPFSSVKMLRELDKDFLVNFIVARSDLNMAEVIKAIGLDKDALVQLVTYETQLPQSLKWYEPLYFKEVTYRMLCDRGDKCKERLKTLKQRGGLDGDGRLAWAAGSYKPAFENGPRGRMVSIMHVPTTATAAICAELTMCRGSVSLQDNHSDMEAALVMPPFPPLKCHTFFASNEGPHVVPVVLKKTPAFEAYVKEIYDKYEAERSALSTTAASGETKAHEALTALKKEQSKVRCANARKRVAETLKQKKARKQFKC